jgi:hypothetical protein
LVSHAKFRRLFWTLMAVGLFAISGACCIAVNVAGRVERCHQGFDWYERSPFEISFCRPQEQPICRTVMVFEYYARCCYLGLALAGLLVVLAFALEHTKEKEVSICFCPHLVSCILVEFDHTASVEAVRTNLNAKIQRLACLPLPASYADSLIRGSQLVIEQMLVSRNFFGERAACFRQPE